MKVKVLITAVIILSFLAGFLGGHMTAKCEPEIRYITCEVIKYRIDKVEVPPEIIYEEIETIVYEPVELRPFESWKELSQWQSQNYIEDVKFNGCVDAALELQLKALNDGYLMSTEITGTIPNLHMICSTVIGDQIIFVDPQGNMSWVGGVKGN